MGVPCKTGFYEISAFGCKIPLKWFTTACSSRSDKISTRSRAESSSFSTAPWFLHTWNTSQKPAVQTLQGVSSIKTISGSFFKDLGFLFFPALNGLPTSIAFFDLNLPFPVYCSSPTPPPLLTGL